MANKQIHELTETQIANKGDYLVIDTGTKTYKIKKGVLVPYILKPITQSEFDALTEKDDSTVYLIK